MREFFFFTGNFFAIAIKKTLAKIRTHKSLVPHNIFPIEFDYDRSEPALNSQSQPHQTENIANSERQTAPPGIKYRETASELNWHTVWSFVHLSMITILIRKGLDQNYHICDQSQQVRTMQ